MLDRRGFSLLEMMISAGLLAIVVGVSTMGFLSVFERMEITGNSSDMKYDIAVFFDVVQSKLHNVIKLDPGEPLATNKGEAFKGVAGFVPFTGNCKVTGNSNIQALRWTRIDNRALPERLLRAWSEKAPDSGGRPWLRMSGGVAGQKNMFSTGGNFKEVAIIDGDGLQVGRYSVKGHRNITTTKDPYSDLPSRPVQTFHYTEVQLHKVKNAIGKPIPMGDRKYISNSLVYPSHTEVVCVNKDGDIVMVSEDEGGEDRVLFTGKGTGFEVSQLAFQFQVPDGPDNVKRIPFPADANQAHCISAVEMSLELTRRDDRNEEKKLFTHSFSMTNLANKIPQFCFNI